MSTITNDEGFFTLVMRIDSEYDVIVTILMVVCFFITIILINDKLFSRYPYGY
jgi:hypothetical protein